jgi:rod shape determining protein RodA
VSSLPLDLGNTRLGTERSLGTRRGLDSWVLLAPLGLVLIGVLLLYSATYVQEARTPLLETLPIRHGIFALMGIVAMLILARLDYRLLASLSPIIYAGALGLLVLVMLVGESMSGVNRWINLGLFPLQPSELAKPAVAITLARYFSALRERSQNPLVVLGSLVIVGVPALLVYKQPDLGTAVVFGGIWLGMAIMGGVRITYLTILALLVVVSLPFLYNFGLQDYMQQRLLIFLNPGQDPLGAGYNILQSEISIGSGGLIGKGFLNGTQTQLDYLRVQQTDFIFSVLGEELGFVGAAGVFGLYLIILLRGLGIAGLARDDFGRLLATGIVMILLVQVFINVGVNVRLLPVTGIPLPFLSFGGSSLISMMLSLGILQSVYVHRLRPDW